MQTLNEGPTCRALFRTQADGSAAGWMAHATTDHANCDLASSLGVAMSVVMDRLDPQEMAGAHAAGRVLAGEARKLDTADVVVRSKGWWITECRIIGELDGKPITAEGTGDGAVALAVEDLQRQIAELA